MPFTQDQFFDVFVRYNAAMWPLPLLTYLLGVAAFCLTFISFRVSTALISTILAFMWFVNGAAYHWSFFSEINPAARGFGVIFAIQALLLFFAPLVWPSFRIAARRDTRTFAGLGFAAYSMLGYPAFGWLVGHAYPAVPVFGIAPCPTTIFTMGILMLGTWKVARWLLVIPAIWAMIGGSAAVLLNVPQDYGLIAALVVAVVFAAAMARGAAFALHHPIDT